MRLPWVPAFAGTTKPALSLRPASILFAVAAAAILVAGYAATASGINDYYFYAGYIVLQYVVIATAWNILGGYAGYVNFGSAGFYAVGAYTAAILYQLAAAPLVVMILGGGIAAGIHRLGRRLSHLAG